MLDELQAASLIILIIGHGFLIRGCFSIRDGLPVTGEQISDKIEGVSTLLDEMNDLIHSLTDVMPSGGPSASAQTGGGWESLLSAFLMPKTPSPLNHGRSQEPQDWTDDEIISPPTLETENELD